MRSLVIALPFFFLVGCNEASEQVQATPQSPWDKVVSAGDYQIAAHSTPDTLVKQWWRLQDANASLEEEICLQMVALIPTRIEAENFASDVLLDWLKKTPSCLTYQYDRKIVEVDEQSSTMAVVYAIVRNVTPADPGWVAYSDARERKERGERYKYVISRESPEDAWKIENIYEFPSYKREWIPIYEQINPQGHDFVMRTDQ